MSSTTVPRRDTLTALDTALTGVGPLAYGLATTNHAVSAVGALSVALVVGAVLREAYVVAAIIGATFWVAQVALATARPRRSPANDAAAVVIGAVSAFHYVTTINLRYSPVRTMAVCRAIILVCHAVSAVVAVVIIGAGQTLTTAWGCYGSVPLADMNLGCCGDDPSLPWVVDNDPMPICRTVDCTTSPPVTKWFGPAAAMAMHMQAVAVATYAVATTIAAADATTLSY